ncbi:MAG: methionyl-tRNA formyltransferase [Candidatus Paceibacterota bacterium]|jgi:methionyl-tRNA formyltransferase
MDKSFIFFGTDEFSVKTLETLAKHGLKPSLVVTIPDKPQGRKNVITPPLVKIWAQENNIHFLQPISLRESKFAEQLKTTEVVFFLVASYGKIIPQTILDIPPKGVLNIHPSLLPKYRGPSPLETAILNGEDETGVTIMLVDAEMDHGPLLAEQKISLQDCYNFRQLRDKTAIIGANLLVNILSDYLSGNLKPQTQNHNEASYTRKFTKEDGLLDLSAPTLENYRKILALNPWPGTYFVDRHNNQSIRVKATEAKLENNKLVLTRVIPEGRKEMNWSDYQRGKH